MKLLLFVFQKLSVSHIVPSCERNQLIPSKIRINYYKQIGMITNNKNTSSTVYKTTY